MELGSKVTRSVKYCFAVVCTAWEGGWVREGGGGRGGLGEGGWRREGGGGRVGLGWVREGEWRREEGRVEEGGVGWMREGGEGRGCSIDL